MDRDVSVFETNIRLVGGLLSCFALTGDAMFRDKAREVAERLLPAFDTPTGVPRALVNLKTGHSKNYRWVSVEWMSSATLQESLLKFSNISHHSTNFDRSILLEKLHRKL